MSGRAAFLDTNVLVRHLTGEPAGAAGRAGRYLATARALFVPDLVLAELTYVLEKHYRAPRAQIAEAVRAVLAYPSVKTVDRDLLYRTIEIFEVHRLDFADAYLIACAEVSGVGAVASFDHDIGRIGTVERIEP